MEKETEHPWYAPNGLVEKLTFITPVNDNIFLTPNLQYAGNIVFDKIKINKNRDNGGTTKVYYNDMLIFDEEEYLKHDNQFIKIIKETNV